MRLILSYTHLYLLLAITSSCTLCFQNISVHGNAENLADDTQTNTPTVDTNANFSLVPKVPKMPYMNGPAAPVGPK